MIDPLHERCPRADDVAPFTIGALDSDAAHDFPAHLLTCARCRAQVEELRGIVTMLPLTVERRQPPPELKQRVMGVVRSEAELLRAAGPAADRAEAPGAPGWHRRIVAGAALVGAIATAIFALAVIGLGDGGEPETRSVRAEVVFPSAHGRVELRDGSGTLVTTGMPLPDRDRVYAIWTQRPGESPQFAGTLTSDRGPNAMRARIEGDLAGVRTVMVTLEPAAVRRSPTATPVLTARLT